MNKLKCSILRASKPSVWKIVLLFLLLSYQGEFVLAQNQHEATKKRLYPGGQDEEDLEVLKELEPIDRKVSTGELSVDSEAQEIEEF